MLTPSSRMSVRQTATRSPVSGSLYSTTRVRIGVSSTIAANSNVSMSAMPPAA